MIKILKKNLKIMNSFYILNLPIMYYGTDARINPKRS